MVNGHGVQPKCPVEETIYSSLENWRKKNEYSCCTDISLSKLWPYLHGIPVEHKMPGMLEVKKMGLRTMMTTQSSRLVRHTGIRHPCRCLMTRIETLVNIHYLRKNNTDFEGGFLE